MYSSRMACPDCGISIPPLESALGSRQHVYGACRMQRTAAKYDFDPARIIVDWSKPLLDGRWGPASGSAYLQRMLAIVGEAYNDRPLDPFEKFSPKVQNLLLYGAG